MNNDFTFERINCPVCEIDNPKNIEFQAAKFVNWIGKAIGKGMYMDIRAQKK